jgi:hypothetical protein
MTNQLKELNSNIQAKDRKIRKSYPSMKRVEVYFKIEVYSKDFSEILYESNDLNHTLAKKVWAELMSSERYMDCVKQFVRYQSGGYVGGIILGGSREVIQNVVC